MLKIIIAIPIVIITIFILYIIIIPDVPMKYIVGKDTHDEWESGKYQMFVGGGSEFKVVHGVVTIHNYNLVDEEKKVGIDSNILSYTEKSGTIYLYSPRSLTKLETKNGKIIKYYFSKEEVKELFDGLILDEETTNNISIGLEKTYGSFYKRIYSLSEFSKKDLEIFRDIIIIRKSY